MDKTILLRGYLSHNKTSKSISTGCPNNLSNRVSGVYNKIVGNPPHARYLAGRLELPTITPHEHHVCWDTPKESFSLLFHLPLSAEYSPRLPSSLYVVPIAIEVSGVDTQSI
jgi:hypothetical protein